MGVRDFENEKAGGASWKSSLHTITCEIADSSSLERHRHATPDLKRKIKE